MTFSARERNKRYPDRIIEPSIVEENVCHRLEDPLTKTDEQLFIGELGRKAPEHLVSEADLAKLNDKNNLEQNAAELRMVIKSWLKECIGEDCSYSNASRLWTWIETARIAKVVYFSSRSSTDWRR